MPVDVGTRLGPYEVLGLIGAGGMGEVYRAHDHRLDRVVAIKVLPSSLAVDEQFRHRFDREARAISQLSHPNICVLHDIGHERPLGSAGPEVSFLVMEYLDGETLAARLSRGALPIAQALAYAAQIAGAPRDRRIRSDRDCSAHRDGRDSRNGAVHVAGAAGRRRLRCADRYLRLRRDRA